LPCSETIIFVSSSEFFSIKSLNLNKILALCNGGTCDHFINALLAISTASSTSFFVAKFTFAETSPVAGLNTSEVLFEVPEKIFR